MENKINIAELLKDCPKGMELDCMMFENIYFDYVDIENNLILCYSINDNIKTGLTFSKYGTYSTIKQSKCVIFPKGKTTWEGFQRPFKNGDVASTINGKWIGIVKKSIDNAYEIYIAIHDGSILYNNNIFYFERFATEEEKQKLFDAIKANGYKWNAETKTLEKLIEPRFKVGNRIKYINGKNKDGVEQGVILSLTNDTYDVAVTNDMGIFIPISEQDDWELVPNKFDINTLKAFESRVLVRNTDCDIWRPAIYGFTDLDKYYVVGGVYWGQCIPYEENKELLGTTNNLEEYGSR